MADPIKEIAAAVEKAQPEATGAAVASAAVTGEAPAAPGATPGTPGAPGTKPPGASHKEGDLTRKPGETRGRKTNAEREAERLAEAEKTLQEQIETRAREIADYQVTGRQLADGFIYFNVTCFGTEFNYLPPIKDGNGVVVKDERQEFYKIGGDMAEQYGWRQLPPYIQIALVLTAYYGIRAAMPPVRQRFGGWFKGAWLWCAGKMNKIFSKKPKDPPSQAALTAAASPATPGAPEKKA